MKKRIVALLIALCLVCGIIPAVSATTVASGTCGENLTWRLEDETLYIEGEGDMYDYGSLFKVGFPPTAMLPGKR